MNKDQIDCERFIRGADEINRKRQIITRVITTVESKLNLSSLKKDRHFKYKQIVLEIPLNKFGFILVCNKSTICGEFVDQNGDRQFRWFGTTNRADGIPAYAVPTIHNHLSKIVEKTDETFPNAGIRAHFDFFSKQAT